MKKKWFLILSPTKLCQKYKKHDIRAWCFGKIVLVLSIKRLSYELFGKEKKNNVKVLHSSASAKSLEKANCGLK